MPDPLELPLISVVTVVLNGGDLLHETVRSVLGQTYPKLEYIVVDGGSTDGTLDLIRRYDGQISRWISQKDRGVYDAMNKGAQLAKGEWINFMNSGDLFYDPDVLMRLFGHRRECADVLYGNVHIRYPEFARIERAGPPERLWRGMQFSHQSVFVRLSQHRQYPFNISNPIASDLGFFYAAFLRGEKFRRVDLVIASVATGGISEGNRVKSILASRDAVCRERENVFVRLFFYGCVISSMLRSTAKLFLPKSLVKKLILRKSR